MRWAREQYVRLSGEADSKTNLAADSGLTADESLPWRQAYHAQAEASEALKLYERALQDLRDYVVNGRKG
jgi:hypothetical protein